MNVYQILKKEGSTMHKVQKVLINMNSEKEDKVVMTHLQISSVAEVVSISIQEVVNEKKSLPNFLRTQMSSN